MLMILLRVKIIFKKKLFCAKGRNCVCVCVCGRVRENDTIIPSGGVDGEQEDFALDYWKMGGEKYKNRYNMLVSK